jgi:hypothetical protein
MSALYTKREFGCNPQSNTWNLVERSMTAPPPVLSPSSILPPPSTAALSLSQGKDQRAFQKFYYFNFLYFLKFLTLKLSNFELRKTQSVRMHIISHFIALTCHPVERQISLVVNR